MAFRGKTISEIAECAGATLLDYLQRHPHDLYNLKPRRIEEVVASLIGEFGFQVELTKQTRDGGKDIIAIKHNSTRDRYLIECKLYQGRNVGVEIVQRLFGVIKLEGAYGGVVVTTSGFSQPALEIVKARWELNSVDFDGLTRWLQYRQRAQMLRTIGAGLDRSLT